MLCEGNREAGGTLASIPTLDIFSLLPRETTSTPVCIDNRRVGRASQHKHANRPNPFPPIAAPGIRVCAPSGSRLIGRLHFRTTRRLPRGRTCGRESPSLLGSVVIMAKRRKVSHKAQPAAPNRGKQHSGASKGAPSRPSKPTGDSNVAKQGSSKPPPQRTEPIIPFSPEDKILLVGEGDLSFATSLIEHH